MIDNATRRMRLAAVRAEMAGSCDLLVVAPTDNARYLLGFSTHPDERLCVYLATAERDLMIVPSLNADQVAERLPELELVRWADADGPAEAVRSALTSLGIGEGMVRFAVDPELRADHLLILQAALPPQANAFSAIEVLGPVREVKDQLEIELLQRCAEIDDEAVQAVFGALAPGVTELELVDVVARCFQAHGGTPEFAIVGSGPNGAFPHHESGSRPLQVGDAVVIDIGGRVGGYPSDITRMAYLGKPSARYREVHAIVEAAVQAGIAASKPGVTCAEVDAAARQVIEDAGYGQHFVHRLGHGLGVSVHEAPWIMAGNDEPLRAGAVHSVEPGIYLPGEFGVRLEDIVHVTAQGAKRLSSLSRDVHVVMP